MSVKIRLKRMGSKKRPFFRLVATDSRNPRDGRFIETLGYYNPIVNPPDVNVKEDLVFKWLRNGATPSVNVESLLRSTGTMKKWSLLRSGVAEADLDAKYEELKGRETQPMSDAERQKKVEAKVTAEEKAKAAEEARLAAEAAAAAAPAPAAAPAEAPAETDPPAEGESA